MPFAKTDDRVRIDYEVHGRHARSDSPEDPAKYSFQRWALDLETVLEFLAWCERRGRG